MMLYLNFWLYVSLSTIASCTPRTRRTKETLTMSDVLHSLDISVPPEWTAILNSDGNSMQWAIINSIPYQIPKTEQDDEVTYGPDGSVILPANTLARPTLFPQVDCQNDGSFIALETLSSHVPEYLETLKRLIAELGIGKIFAWRTGPAKNVEGEDMDILYSAEINWWDDGIAKFVDEYLAEITNGYLCDWDKKGATRGGMVTGRWEGGFRPNATVKLIVQPLVRD